MKHLFIVVLVAAVVGWGNENWSHRFDSLGQAREVFADIDNDMPRADFEQQLPQLMDDFLEKAISERLKISGIGDFSRLSPEDMERLRSANVAEERTSDVLKRLHEDAVNSGIPKVVNQLIQTSNVPEGNTMEDYEKFFFNYLNSSLTLYGQGDMVQLTVNGQKVKGKISVVREDRVRIDGKWCHRQDMPLSMQANFWKEPRTQYIQRQSHDLAFAYMDKLKKYIAAFMSGNADSKPYLPKYLIPRVDGSGSSKIGDWQTPFELRKRLEGIFLKCFAGEVIITQNKNNYLNSTSLGRMLTILMSE